MTTARGSKIEVEVRKHARSDEHWNDIVTEHWNGIVTTSRGYCYYCTWAGDAPSVETVEKAWAQDRKKFLPFYDR